MPELPEVEVYRRYVERHALRKSVTGVSVLDARILGDLTPRALNRGLAGRQFLGTHRHGKHLFVATDGGPWLYLHFGMSGDIFYYRGKRDRPRFARVLVRFSDSSELAYDDMRLFGVVDLVDDPGTFIEERGLGPDPLDRKFTLPVFRRILAGRKGAIKSLLMSQQIVAGLGNLYVDEILFRTAVHPQTAADLLTAADVARVFRAIRPLLLKMIIIREAGAPNPPRSLISHREEGERCPLCGGEIRRTVVFGRTTYFCGNHQRLVRHR
ncbi:MAG: DNA-formamidopyrimidine glycosylase family protein [Acidobacteriota bacterium]